MRPAAVWFSACFFVSLVTSADVHAGDNALRDRAIELIKSKKAKLTYGKLFRAGVEGVSLVRHIYSPAEYVLIGSPELLHAMATGGASGGAKKIGTDLLFGLAAAMLDHPKVAARKVASWGYRQGLSSYRSNYRVYHKYRRTPDRVPLSVAREFHRNWYLQDLMGVAKKLYNDISAYERGTGRYSDTDRARRKQVQSKLEQLLKSTKSRDLDRAALWLKVYQLVDASNQGLPDYPPYRDYDKAARMIWAAYLKEVAKLSAVKEQGGHFAWLTSAGNHWSYDCIDPESGEVERFQVRVTAAARQGTHTRSTLQYASGGRKWEDVLRVEADRVLYASVGESGRPPRSMFPASKGDIFVAYPFSLPNWTSSRKRIETKAGAFEATCLSRTDEVWEELCFAERTGLVRFSSQARHGDPFTCKLSHHEVK